MAENNGVMPINSLCCYVKTEIVYWSQMGIASWVVAGFSIFSFAINIICDISLHSYL